MPRSLLAPLALLVAAPLVAGALLVTSSARAADVELDHFAPGAIKLDGKPTGKEWPGTTAASVTIAGGKVSGEVHAGYDDDGVWIGAAVVKDGPIARTAAFGAKEDCVSLILAFPTSTVGAPAPSYAAYEVGLYAGVPGSSAGAVKMRSSGASVPGAKIVEAPRKGGGYTLEAFVPWSAFPEASKTRAGLRGAVRLYDGDGSALRGIKATSAGSVDDPRSLGWFLIEPEVSLPGAFASRKLAWKDVLWDVTADVAGDAKNERLILVGRALYLLGPTYKQGKQWLNVEFGSDVVALDARDVTGDGRAELVLTMRVKAGSTLRDAVHVDTFGGEKGAEKPIEIFAHESRVDGGSGKELRDVVSFGSKKIDVTYAAPKGWTAASWDQPTASDVDPILFPWGPVKQRTFVLKAGAYVKDKEVAQAATVVAGGGAGGAGGPTSGTPTVAPPLVKGDPALGALAQYRKDKGLADGAAPRMETVITVAGGKKGRAALFGRDLVVTAPDGTYAYVTMSRFASDKDVLEVGAQDATGDGREDVVVRGLVRAKMTGGPDGDQEVLREVVVVYAPRVSGSGVTIAPVFSLEVARAMGSKRVDAEWKVGKGTITVAKGSAKGWSASSWPFSKETPTPGLEPLVLPWSTPSSVTYTWSSDKFVR